MGKRGSLEDLIADLGELEKNFDRLLQQKYDNIMAMIMVAIGKSTAYDTGVSRDIIKQILTELGRSDLEAELDHVIWEFWKTRGQRMEDPHTHRFVRNGYGRYEIEIEDYGFTQQNEGYVSPVHPRSDSRVVPNQVDYGIDLMETGTDSGIEKAFNELEDFIVKALDGDI